jgi:hypothetical protein
MRTRAETIWVVVCAVIGGMIVGPFHLEPAWAWGMLGGAVGGVLGGIAGYITTLRWPWPVRALVAVLVVGLGFFGLWVLTSFHLVVEMFRRTLGG